MKAVILAGGFGTRIAEESDLKPKPMVEIGGHPLLWHIMKLYHHHNIREFIICLGYKGHIIKDFFMNYHLYTSDLKINLASSKHQILSNRGEDWEITLIDTGLATMTGGRIKRILPYLQNETFCLTYGDGVSDVNITDTIAFHKKHQKLATVVAVQPQGRFGVLNFDDTRSTNVTTFEEKPNHQMGWINGGFFVLEPGVMDYIPSDETVWEKQPLMELAKNNELVAYQHTGYWQPCDTLRDKRELEKLWQSAKAPWAIWNGVQHESASQL